MHEDPPKGQHRVLLAGPGQGHGVLTDMPAAPLIGGLAGVAGRGTRPPPPPPPAPPGPAVIGPVEARDPAVPGHRQAGLDLLQIRAAVFGMPELRDRELLLSLRVGA